MWNYRQTAVFYVPVWRRGGFAIDLSRAGFVHPQDIPPDIFHPDISPSRTIPPPFLHGTIFTFYRHYPRIYNTKRSTVHTYRIDIAEDRLGRGVWVSANFQKKNPNLVGRLGSEIRVSASFQNFALTAVGKCPRWRGTLSGREKCI